MIMDTTRFILFIAFVLLCYSTAVQILRIIRAGRYPDPSAAKSPVIPGILFSFTKGMAPWKKETAYGHLPTYTAGILYHLGSFLGLFILPILFFRISIPPVGLFIGTVLLAVASLAGLGILIKRITNKKMRSISNPDDYASNLIVTVFQILTAVSLNVQNLHPILFIYSAALLLYIPMGKLKHIVYFFLARIQLGLFYGKRGIWPVKRRHSWQNTKH